MYCIRQSLPAPLHHSNRVARLHTQPNNSTPPRMTTVVSGTSGYQQVTKVKLDHDIRTVVQPDLEEITHSRSVAHGKSMSKTFRISSMWTEDGRGTFIPVQRVESYQQYAAGCTIHSSDCSGHFCVTPRGSVLFPQKLASTVGVMSNDYAKMAESLFNRDTRSQELVYRERASNLMLGKTGNMRGPMPAGVVDGSAREIIATCWQLEVMSKLSGNDTLYFAIPRRVAANMRIPRMGVDKDTGLGTGLYAEDCLREGDYVIAVRPPSLWAGNVQPLKVLLWDHECFGLAPSLAADFHADHDGDEMQIYYVGSDSSLDECKRWKRLTPNVFDGVSSLKDLPKNIHEGESNLVSRFMQHTTISMKELMLGEQMPDGAKLARVKDSMADMLAQRLKNPRRVYKEFVAESRRGVTDVMAQQVDQGLIGDMSRQAKLAASCVQYKGNGVFSIKTACGAVKTVSSLITGITHDPTYPLGGNSCMRAISMICAKAQQAALDSHRVTQVSSNDIDLIRDFMQGGPTTLVAMRAHSSVESVWKYVDATQKVAYYLVDPKNVKSAARNMTASYSPSVLKAVKLVGNDPKEACHNGIKLLCNYYGISLSQLEMASVVELMSYRVDASSAPITSKLGVSSREARWLVAVFANHYGKLRQAQKKGYTKRPVHPETITEAAALCNYSYL